VHSKIVQIISPPARKR